MKKYIPFALILFTITSFSQQDYVFGILNAKDKEMVVYEKDSTANAVVLYEEANTDFFVYNDNWIYIRTKIYRKIKIFNKEGFDQADVSIIADKNSKRKELVKNIRGITHNKGKVTALNKSNIYTTEKSEYRDEIAFTLPDIKEGSVIEYTYTIESPFKFNFTGWTFQNEIPTVESVFIAEIPGNYIYNRKLIGYQKLTRNDAEIKKKCFRPSNTGYSDCEILTYSMTDVPAFIEEDYMTSKWNYISRIDFELSEYKGFDGHNTKYTKTWKNVDREFKSDKNVGGQLRKNTFFKKQLPDDILNEVDVLKRAKKVYHFIQNHFTWNKKHRLFNKINITKAFNEKVGNNTEINLSLINALKACDIDTELVLISTRKNGYPTKLYPVISDFNHSLARVNINGVIYLLDATDKNLPFGGLPYKCLNKEGRVMDFKNGSYWEEIVPMKNNGRKVQMLLKLNEDEEFAGNMRIVHNGYSAISKRNTLDITKEESYIENYEDENDFLEIVSYKNFNLNNNDKPFKEEFEINIENDTEINDMIYLNPFFIDRLDENPFKLNNRQYPVNFGYPLKFDFTLSIVFPDNFSIESIPKSRIVKLPDNKGHFVYKVNHQNSKIAVNYSFNINEIEFNGQDYLYLKEFFKQAIIAQNEPIILKKN